MKRNWMTIIFLLLLGGIITLAGCGNQAAETAPASATEIAPVSASTAESEPMPAAEAPALAPAFDENSIILTFGAMADAHVMSKDSRESSEDLMNSMGQGDIEVKGDLAIMSATVFHTNEYLENGLKFLEAEAGGDLDCMVLPGDLTNTGSQDDAIKFYEIFTAALKNPEMPLLYSTGNHDQLVEGGGEGEYLREAFSDAAYAADVVTDGPGYSRHSVVNGIHFIELDGDDYEVGGILYTKAAHEFLRDSLAEAAADAPGKPIFVIAHTSIPGTVAGSNCMAPDFPTLIWSTDELRECLSGYPQVVLLSGHTHYSQNSDRTIYQDDFTMLNIGPMQYMITNYGFYNLGEGYSVLPEEFDKHPQAMLFDVDANGSIRIRRYDVGLLKQQGETWYVKAPGYADSLSDFRSNRAAKPGPIFKTNDLKAEVADGTVTLTFSKASGNGSQVYYYWICAVDENGKTVLERKYHTDLYSAPQEENMRDSWQITLDGLAPGKYTVTVTACNVWDALGDTQTVEVSF